MRPARSKSLRSRRPQGSQVSFVVFDSVRFQEQNELVAERNVLVRQAVGSLPIDLRQVVVMKEFEDMTFQEISDTLEIPLSTVKSRLYTALKQLRSKLERLPMEIG